MFEKSRFVSTGYVDFVVHKCFNRLCLDYLQLPGFFHELHCLKRKCLAKSAYELEGNICVSIGVLSVLRCMKSACSAYGKPVLVDFLKTNLYISLQERERDTENALVSNAAA